MPKISIDIDTGNMSKTLAKVNYLENQLELAMDEGLTDFANMFEQKLRSNMILYGVPNSVVDSVRVYKYANGLTIEIASEKVEFFEYGTGIRGAGSPHPNPPIGWIYDVNGHGSKGWWYPTDSSDPNPYKWTDGSGTLRAWTKGKFSRPFIYDTTVWGKQSITNVIRKHIRRIKID